VAPNQEATIRFSSFGSKAPTVFGSVLNLSADAIIDQVNGQPYYLARIEVDSESLSTLGELQLLPGMPAEVFIATGSRTLLEYMFKPLSNTIARSFIED
jgi:epimerase transport system membrane fusion protein